MERVEGTIWEMPVVLGSLYGMRRSEILGLRWQNIDLENNTFDVVEQLPFKVPPKTKVIEEIAPPKSNGRKLPITDVARPFFLKQFAIQEAQREQAEKDGKPYYDNDLVVAKPDSAPIAASWVSSQFGKLLDDLDMPHIRFHDLRHSAATNMHQLTGDLNAKRKCLTPTIARLSRPPQRTRKRQQRKKRNPPQGNGAMIFPCNSRNALYFFTAFYKPSLS